MCQKLVQRLNGRQLWNAFKNQELSGLSKGVDCITNFAHKKLIHSVVKKWKKKLRESY